jgi:hypothetical protein
MLRFTSLCLAIALFIPIHFALAEENNPAVPAGGGGVSDDPRQLVAMPEQARALMRQDMLDHLSTLNEILGHLASNNLAAAAEVAESRMGNSSMGKHRASGMGPGRFMPLEMRNLGWTMHAAASEFANVAKQGDVTAAYTALQHLTSACITCHYSYRTR